MSDFDIDCPECGTSIGVDIDDVAKARTVRCRRGHQIKLKDSGGGARKVNNAMSDLDKKLKGMGFK